MITLDNWTVLVVDDEPDNRQLVTDILTYFGANVSTASSGDEAKQLIQQNVYRLVLLDIQMPLVDGYAVLRFIRGSDETRIKQLIVIAVTAEAMRGDRERIMAAGFDGYIAKPLEPATFATLISEIVEIREKS